MAPPQGPHIHGAYTPPPAEPPRWSIASGDSGDGREPDPRQRQLRMESLLPRTVNGTGHTGPSEFCATSI